MRGATALCTCAIALAGISCGADAPSTADEPATLRIHVAEADERALGPLDMLWFLTFLSMSMDLDADGIYEPRLLEGWEHSPDYSQWTLNVREGLRWGDGEPVTAEDVKFSLELWTHPDVLYEYRFFEELEVLDSHTLRMTFPEPVPATLHTYSWLAIVPEHLLGDHSVEELFSWPFWVEPVGNGPFRYVRHVDDVMTELEANSDYYADPPQIRKVVLRYGGDALTELLAGNVDIAAGITPTQAARLARGNGFDLYFRPLPRQVGVAWNHRIPLFQDPSVRRALTMSIDRRELLRVIGYPDDTPIFDVPVARRHYTRDRALIPDPLPFAPDRARQLLSRAGWVDADGDGVRQRDGRAFEFDLHATEETRAQALYLQDRFRDVGVQAEIHVMDLQILRERFRQHEFDAAIYSGFHYIENFDDFPITGYRNVEVSRLRDLAWFNFDPKRSDEHLQKLWQIVGREIPITYLHPQLRIIAAHRRVRGMRDNRELYTFVEHLWIEEEPITESDPR